MAARQKMLLQHCRTPQTNNRNGYPTIAIEFCRHTRHLKGEGGNYNKKKTQINNISWKCLMITQELTSFRILFSEESVKDILYILWYFRKMTQYSGVVKNDVKSTAWIVLRIFGSAIQFGREHVASTYTFVQLITVNGRFFWIGTLLLSFVTNFGALQNESS